MNLVVTMRKLKLERSIEEVIARYLGCTASRAAAKETPPVSSEAARETEESSTANQAKRLLHDQAGRIEDDARS